MPRTYKTRRVNRTLKREDEKLLKAIAKEAECTPLHALRWAVRTLADKRGITVSS